MTKDRMSNLLYNAISCLEEYGCDGEQLEFDLGITEKEYAYIMEGRMYYYDVVVSICNETCRTDSDLICGGFDTKEEALDYINTNDVSEEDYYYRCNEDETAYIEIEQRDALSGNIVSVITVD